jgi:hypothetical protein
MEAGEDARPVGSTLRRLSMGQGAYFLATGIWPLVDIKSFQAVTGLKTDLWLVKTVGVLVGVIGGVLIAAGARRKVTGEISALAIGSAAGLTAIDVVYAAKRRVSPIYLLDAVAEIALIGGWTYASKRRNHAR